MADRRVKRTGKDADGDITSLCGDWGTATKAMAISDLEYRFNSYYVQDSYARRADVYVVDGATGKYLRTDPDAAISDNLGTLPDC